VVTAGACLEMLQVALDDERRVSAETVVWEVVCFLECDIVEMSYTWALEFC
jgi:hypothetical protein